MVVISREVVQQPIYNTRVTLELSPEEAVALRIVLGAIATAPSPGYIAINSITKYTSSIWSRIAEAIEVSSSDITNARIVRTNMTVDVDSANSHVFTNAVEKLKNG